MLSKFVAILVLAFVAIPIVAHFVGAPVLAADPVVKANDIVNPIDTLWTLLAAFLVFGMQAGFTMLEAGFSRSRETVNVLMECIVDTCLCGLLFYAIGFAFMFSTGNGFIDGKSRRQHYPRRLCGWAISHVHRLSQDQEMGS